MGAAAATDGRDGGSGDNDDDVDDDYRGERERGEQVARAKEEQTRFCFVLRERKCPGVFGLFHARANVNVNYTYTYTHIHYRPLMRSRGV